MRKIALFAAIVLSTLVISCSKSVKDAEKVISVDGLAKHISTLASDDFEGRKPFTAGEDKALDYIEKSMKEIGLKPVFENGSYRQAVPLVEIMGYPSKQMDIKLSKRKSMDFNLLDNYVVQSQTTSEESSANNLPIVFAGYGIVAPEYGWNDYEGIDVKGKAVVVLVNDPGYLLKDKKMFNGRAMTYYGRWTYKFEEAARQGAKAVFIVHRADMAGYPWAVPRRMSESSMFSIDDKEKMNACCDFEGWFHLDAARNLFAQKGYDIDKLWDEACSKDFKSFEMNASCSLSIKKTYTRDKSYNIAGKIEGKKRPDEAIIYMAHWDHLGSVETTEGKHIYNGASDNAAGVAWVLEIAKAFKAMPAPDRTVVFISPTVEEEGLKGSYYFVDHSPIPMNKIVCAINTDVLPFIGEFNDITITGYGHSELDDILKEVAESHGKYVAPDPTPENGMFYRSDHFPYMKKGVPCLFAKGMIDNKKHGKEWMTEYMKKYWKTVYHKPTDIYDPKTADLTGIEADARILFNFGYKIANSDMWPKWKEGSEFKDLRK